MGGHVTLAQQAEILDLKKALIASEMRIGILEDENFALKESEGDLLLFCTQKVGEMSGQLKSASSIIAMASLANPGMVPSFNYVESPLPVELGFQGTKKRKGDADEVRRMLLNDSSSTISALD